MVAQNLPFSLYRLLLSNVLLHVIGMFRQSFPGSEDLIPSALYCLLICIIFGNQTDSPFPKFAQLVLSHLFEHLHLSTKTLVIAKIWLHLRKCLAKAIFCGKFGSQLGFAKSCHVSLKTTDLSLPVVMRSKIVLIYFLIIVFYNFIISCLILIRVLVVLKYLAIGPDW